MAEINTHLASLGHRLKTGTIVVASIVTAPSSTKIAKGERAPEMRQTKKGNQWYFGMKAHIGVDAGSGLAHSLETTPTNTSDVATARALLHGGEERVWGDAGYQTVGKREENRDAAVGWQVAMKPGQFLEQFAPVLRRPQVDIGHHISVPTASVSLQAPIRCCEY